MSKRLSALVFLTITSLTKADEPSLQIPLKVIEAGGSVTMDCPMSNNDGKTFSWYKQPLGYMLQTIATVQLGKHNLIEQFNNSRFSFTDKNSHYSFTIKNVKTEDEAVYFCQHGTAYRQNFAAGIHLVVNDCDRQTLIHVKQIPETTSVQEGDTVKLQCSLLPKTSVNCCQESFEVFWFRVGFGESHSSLIYTHKNSSDAQQSCVYRLSKTIQNASDTGIYYCAVVTCGKILLGEGTKVETRPQPVALVLGVLLGCCVTLIVALIIYINKTVFGHFKGPNKPSGQHNSLGNQPSHTEAHEKETEYVALNFSTRKKKGVKKRTEAPPDCVYSAVRAGQPNLS